MTDTPNLPSGDLSSLKVAQLQQIAAELGIKGARRMRKSELIDALRAGQGDQRPRSQAEERPAPEPAARSQLQLDLPAAPDGAGADDDGQQGRQPQERGAGRENEAEQASKDRAGGPEAAQPDRGGDGRQDRHSQDRGDGHRDQGRDRTEQPDRARGGRQDQKQGEKRGQQPADRGPKGDKADGGGRRPSVDDIQLPEPRKMEDEEGQRGRPGSAGPGRGDGGDQRGGNRRRRGRDRNRDRKRRSQRPDDLPYEDVELLPDDVLIPIAGILDVLDNYAFVRTSGYLPGANDVYVSLNQVKRYGLRRGDAIVGAVRQPREGEPTSQRQKFNALVRLDTVNGTAAEEARDRPEFSSLTALYPQDRIRLETKASELATRAVDVLAPIGKGQRGLLVAPPRSGETLLLRQIANAITMNNPEVHLMVVLVDERPEEVTDMERTIKGEVISSTFDRPAADHTVVAELAIERAKRLVELGQDVVVLLDSLTRLTRAYNLSATASGRVLSGGVDAAALYPAKRFFGAARNIEHGGSLTILASVLVQTDSTMDEAIFEAFKGTANSELHLNRQLADMRIFPAVEINTSGTRREDLLIGESDQQAMWKLRRAMVDMDPQQATESLLGRLRSTSSNAQFLRAVDEDPTPGARTRTGP